MLTSLRQGGLKLKNVTMFLTQLSYLNPEFTESKQMSQYLEILDKYDLVEDEKLFLDLIDSYVFEQEDTLNQ